MNTSLSMAATISIDNPLVSTFSYQVSLNYKVTISNFVLVTSIPTQFSGTITINNIAAQLSEKPVAGNTISFYRNGYLYDQSSFSFQVVAATITSINLSLANNNANTATNLTISIGLSVGVISTDNLYVQIDQAISVNTCSVLSCTDCICTIIPSNPSQGIFYSKAKISSFNGTVTNPVTDIIILFGIKNPISSNYTIFLTTTDISNYTK